MSHHRRSSEPFAVEEWLQQDTTTENNNRRDAFHRHRSVGGFLGDAAWSSAWSNSSGDVFGSPTLLSPAPQPTPKRGSSVSSSNNNNASDTNGKFSSVIHDAARITDWDKVLELCQSIPEAAAYSGRDGWTALHHACNRRCPRPDVVQALIVACPEALIQEEEKLWLPLHYACRFKAPREVVRLLLHMYPAYGKIAVEKRDQKGRRPLYYAIRYDAPPGVASLLLQVDPSAVLEEDQNEESPLALVWDSWAEKLDGKRIVHSFLPGGFPEPEDTTVEERAALLRERLQSEYKLKSRWDQVNLLLRAAFGFPFDDEDNDNNEEDSRKSDGGRTWRIVHATAAVKCHLSLFALSCALYPEQARELDEFDLQRPDNDNCGPSNQTALHFAASSKAGGEPGKTVIYTLMSLYREAAQIQDGIDGSLPLHRMVENPKKQNWPNHAAILYHFYPRAVQIADSNQKLPLHRAAAAISHEDHNGGDHEEQSVVFNLVRSFPQAASHLDASGMSPFHYVARNARIWDADVEAIHNANRNAVMHRAFSTRELPIHMAAASTQSEESLIQRIILLHPRGASMEQRDGKLPLHLVCEQGKKWDQGTRCIFEAFPDAVCQAERNERAWKPLHMATACPNDSGDLIDRLVELAPEVASEQDTGGCYPLHLACSSGKTWEGGLKSLFDANPFALSRPDSRGYLPWHTIALQNCKKDDPEKIETKATPEVEAERERVMNEEAAARLDIIFNIIRADPTTIC